MRSVKGASHVAADAPNQDAGKVAAIERGVVLAAADGHGNPLHSRSEKGSALAVEAATEILAGWIAASDRKSNEEIRRLAAQLPAKLVASWRAKVSADLRANPFVTDRLESRAAADQIAGDPSLLYGSTLLAAAVTGRLALYLQIGDGDIVAVDGSGAPRRALQGRTDLPLNRTESLCNADAAQRFQCHVDFFDRRPPDLILLSTDGYANSFADDGSFLMVGRQLKDFLEKRGPDWVVANLPAWLDETSKKGSGDDITVAAAWHGPSPIVFGWQRPAMLAAGLVMVLGIGLYLWARPPERAATSAEQSTATWNVPAVVNAVALVPDGSAVALASDQGVGLWDVAARKLRYDFQGGGRPSAVVISANGQRLAAAFDGLLQVWDLSTGKSDAMLMLEGGGIRALSIAPDGRSIAFGSTDGLALWNLKDAPRPIEGSSGPTNALAFAPTGNHFASGHPDGMVKLWNSESLRALAMTPAGSSGVRSLAYAPNGNIVGSGDQDGTIKLWQADDGKLVRSLEPLGSPVLSLAFSHSGEFVAAAAGTQVVVFEANTGRRAASYAGATRVELISVAPDGKLLAAGAQNKSVYIWERAAFAK